MILRDPVKNVNRLRSNMTHRAVPNIETTNNMMRRAINREGAFLIIHARVA
jgi:hypothetical protein